jgi:hypothetical protein
MFTGFPAVAGALAVADILDIAGILAFTSVRVDPIDLLDFRISDSPITIGCPALVIST